MVVGRWVAIVALGAFTCGVVAACSAESGTSSLSEATGPRLGEVSEELVQQVGAVGQTTTIAGDGTRGATDASVATSGRFNDPAGVAVAPDGTIYVADWGNNSVRRIRPDGSLDTFIYGQPNLIRNPRAEQPQTQAGTIPEWRTVTGSWLATSRVECTSSACGAAFDGSRWFWGGSVVAAEANYNIRSTDLAPYNLNAGQLFHFSALIRSNSSERARVRLRTVDGEDDENDYDSGERADANWTLIQTQKRSNSITEGYEVVLNTRAISGAAADSYFDTFQFRALPTDAERISNSPTADRGLVGPTSVAVGSDGKIYVGADGIYAANAAGTSVVKVAAAGGYSPPVLVSGISTVSDGYTYFSDPTNTRLHVRAPSGAMYYADLPIGGAVLGIAASPGPTSAQHRVWVALRQSYRLRGYNCDKKTATAAVATCTDVATLGSASFAGIVDDMDGTAGGERLDFANGVAMGAQGDLLIALEGDHTIRRNYGPFTRRIAGAGGLGFGDGASEVAKFWSPSAVATTSNGDLIVADRMNNRIRKIACGGSNVCQRTGSGSCWVETLSDGNPCTTDTCQVLAIQHDPTGGACGSQTCSATSPCPTGMDCSVSGYCFSSTASCESDLECPANKICAAGKGASNGNGRTSSACVDPFCATPAAAADCGYAGARCKCGNGRQCTLDTDCPSGEACVEDAGPQVGLPVGTDVCMPTICKTDPAAGGCGTVDDPCGRCQCVPNCASKTCATADKSDGCGGRCNALCDPAETGCVFDSDCAAGNICPSGKCVPADPCGKDGLAPPLCGSPTSLCGACPPVTVGASCADRVCGADPVTGANCGSCSANQFCNAAGRCAQQETTPPISVPTGVGGGTRVVAAPTAPAAPTGVGASFGEFSVTDRGSSSYSVPIELPPGRANIAPQLAVRYNSSTANGALGIGWSLDGLSAITRCPRTYAQDGYSRPILNDATDALCLDGQRLVSVGANEYRTQIDSFSKIVSTPGNVGPASFTVYAKDGRVMTYGGSASSRELIGAAVTTWHLNRVEDRAGNFYRIVYEQTGSINPLTDVTSTAELAPSAITYTGFGSIDGDREVKFLYETTRPDQLTGYRAGGGAFSRIRRLKTVEVRAQNVLVRKYGLTYEQAPNRVSRLASLQECAGASSAACKRPTVFSYFDEAGFDAGINVPIPVESGFSVAPPISPYGIVHKSDDGYDLLTVLSATANPYIVTPIPPGVDMVVGAVPAVGAGIAAATITLINALGAEKRNRLWYESFTWNVGRDESLVGGVPCPNTGGQVVGMRHLIGNDAYGRETVRDQCPVSKVLTQEVRNPRTGGSYTTFVGIKYVRPEWLVDLDGDGIQDMLYCAEEGSTASFSPTHLDFKFAKAANATTPAPPLNPTHAQRDGEVPTFGRLCQPPSKPGDDRLFTLVMDIDGDGAGDLIAYDPKLGWAVLLKEGLNFVWTQTYFAGVTIKPEIAHVVSVMDVNGDGLRDLFAQPEPSGNLKNFGTGPDAETLSRTPLVAINTGRGFNQIQLAATDATASRAPSFPGYVVDLDHDGVEEYVAHTGTSATASNWKVRRIVNGALEQSNVGGLNAGPGTLGDFDGDGNIDALTQVKAQVPRLFHGIGRRQNLLKQVTDGDGHQVDISYDASHADGSATYDKLPGSGTCRWPQRCVARVPHALVSSFAESHYDDQARTRHDIDRDTTYYYKGARVDVAGYGWLGFSSRDLVVRDAVGDVTFSNHTEFVAPKQWTVGSAAPYVYLQVGMPSLKRDILPHADSPISTSSLNYLTTESSYGYTEQTSTSGRPFVYLGSTSIVTKELVNEVTTRGLMQRTASTVRDGYGNVTSDTVTSQDLAANLSPIAGSQTKTTTTTTFSPTAGEVSSWLVGLAKNRVIESTPRCATTAECNSKTRRREQTFTYFANRTNLLTASRGQSTESAIFSKTTFVRDSYGNVTESNTVGNGVTRTSKVSYDARGIFPISSTEVGDAVSLTSQMRFDDRFGEVIVQADPNGIDETRSFDDFGALRTYRGPSGEGANTYAASDFFVSDGHDIPAAYVFTTTRQGGSAAETHVDSFGRIVRRKSKGFEGTDVFEEFSFDDRSRLRVRSRPHLAGDASQGSLLFEYDDLNQLTSVESADGSITRYAYGTATSLSSTYASVVVPGGVTIRRTTDPREKVSFEVKDRDGLVVNAVDAFQKSTTYKYAAFGDLEKISGPGGDISFAYDAYGRQTTVSDAAHGGDQKVEYTAFDQIWKVTNAALQTRTHQYDKLGRRTRIDDIDGVTTWTYDGTGAADNQLGMLVESTSPSGQKEKYGYEAREATRNRGLLTSTTLLLLPPGAPAGTTPTSLTTSLLYDGNARLSRVEYPLGAASRVDYDYDAYGNVKRAFNPTNSKDYWRLSRADQGYRIGEERLGNHACGASTGTGTVRSYVPLTGLLSAIKTDCGATAIQNLAYGYDAAGNRTVRNDVKASAYEEFSYDDINRITKRRSSPTGAFADYATYDPNGRGRIKSLDGIGEFTYETTGRDWLKTAGSYVYEHDLVGNVKRRSGPGLPGNTEAFDYTQFNLPKRVTTPGIVVEFGYTADGARAVSQKTGASLTRVYYAGDAYQRIEQAGVVSHRFVVMVAGRAVAQVQLADTAGATPTIQYLHDDALGSVQSVSTATGALVTARFYTPFGNRTGGSFSDVPAGFTGHESEEDLRLINMRGRMFDPASGQFLTPDPVIQQPFGQGLNRFAYVNNSPLNFVDPSGFSAARDAQVIFGFSSEEQDADDWIGRGAFYGAVGLAAYGAVSATVVGGATTAGGAAVALATSSAAALPTGMTVANGVSSLVGPLGSAIAEGLIHSGAGAPTHQTIKPKSSSSVGDSGGAPARNAGARNSYAPVQERAPGIAAAPPRSGRPADADFRIWEDEVRAHAYGQSALDRGSIITAKEGLARVAAFAATRTRDPVQFVNLLARALANVTIADPGNPRGAARVPNFTDTGFRPDLRDNSNQVRHFAGGLAVGARYGGRIGAFLNTGREMSTLGSGASMADVRLGNEAASLGSDIVSGKIKPSQVADLIRTRF